MIPLVCFQNSDRAKNLCVCYVMTGDKPRRSTRNIKAAPPELYRAATLLVLPVVYRHYTHISRSPGLFHDEGRPSENPGEDRIKAHPAPTQGLSAVYYIPPETIKG